MNLMLTMKQKCVINTQKLKKNNPNKSLKKVVNIKRIEKKQRTKKKIIIK